MLAQVAQRRLRSRVRVILPVLLFAGCAPLTGGPLPIPLGQDTTSTVEIAAVAMRARTLRDEAPAELSDPPVPYGQVLASSTFKLHERVDAGPSFLLDLGPRAGPGPVTGGLFVRVWTTQTDADLRVALRMEAGWAWGGVGLDMSVPVGDDATVTLAPTMQLTPAFVAGRLPVGAVIHLAPLDLALEAGVSAGAGWSSGDGVVPWLAVRMRLSL